MKPTVEVHPFVSSEPTQADVCWEVKIIQLLN